jgi:hypothetical protein
MNIAIMIDPLIQSALNQNTEAELRGNPQERSQGSPAMDCHEEARFRRPMGWRLGPARRRASPNWAKPVFSASLRRFPAAAHAVSGGQSGRVLRAITSGTWFGHTTGEVPPGLAARRVTAGYKGATKGQPHARVAATASYRRRLQGCQQRQSSPAHRDERQNLKQSVQLPATRIVSSGSQAAKWPAGTSSRQLSLRLRNIPTGAAAVQNRPGRTF